MNAIAQKISGQLAGAVKPPWPLDVEQVVLITLQEAADALRARGAELGDLTWNADEPAEFVEELRRR